MQRLSVLFSTPRGCYDYLVESPLPAGQVISAPLGRRQEIGVVWPTQPDLSVSENKLKTITKTLDIPPMPAETIRFIEWVSRYTLSPLGMVLKMALIPDPEKRPRR